MLIESEQLIGLNVETESSQNLGKVDGFVLETDGQTIFQYKVKPNGITHMFAKELLVSRDQVISIQKDKMIVDDILYEQAQAQEITKTKSPQAEPIASVIEK
jgi:uncharacterized protein YrrD